MPRFNNKQTHFVVSIMLSGFLETISTTVPERWMDGRHDEQWKKDIADFKKNFDVDEFLNININQIGWHLSIFAAQLYNIEIGVSDALSLRFIYEDKETDLEELLSKWYHDTTKGNKGIAVYKDNPNAGRSQVPDAKVVAAAWLKSLKREFSIG